jgi:hypothetical protein
LSLVAGLAWIALRLVLARKREQVADELAQCAGRVWAGVIPLAVVAALVVSTTSLWPAFVSALASSGWGGRVSLVASSIAAVPVAALILAPVGVLARRRLQRTGSGGTAPDVAALDAATMASREAVLALWAVLALTGAPLVWAPAWYVAVLILTGASAAIAGPPSAPSRFAPRWLLLGIAAIGHRDALRAALVAAHDRGVHALVHSPIDPTLVLGALVVVGAGTAAFVLMTRDLIWRLRVVNLAALHVIRRRHRLDRWERWFGRRHRVHSLAVTGILAFIARLAAAWFRHLFGTPPDLARKTTRPHRDESFLQDHLLQASLRAEDASRACRLDGSPPGAAKLAELDEALRDEAAALRLLYRYLLCPERCSPEGFFPERCPAPDLVTPQIAEDLARRMLSHRSRLAERQGYGGEAPAQDRCDAQVTLHLAERAGPEWHDALRRAWAWLADIPTTDRSRAAARSEMLTWLGKPQGDGQTDFVVEHALRAYRAARDWEGGIEMVRQLELRKKRMSAGSHLEVGEAYFRHAREVDAGLHAPLAHWALEQACAHFVEAKAADFLRLLATTVPAVRREVTDAP